MADETGATGETGEDQAAQGETGSEGSEKLFTQADIDRAAAKAAKTREANLRQEFERAKLSETERIAAELEAERAEKNALLLRVQTREQLGKAGLGDVAGIFDLDLNSIDGRVAASKAISKRVDSLVEERIKEKLKTELPPKGKDDTVDKRPDQMTPEEYQAFRKAKGIH